MFLKSLSGRFLLLTVFFVMLAEVLIFVPSVSRFRVEYLQARLERSQIASLALLATSNDMVEPELEKELLENAGVLNIVLRRDIMRELVLATPMLIPVDETYDLRDASPYVLIRDAFTTLLNDDNRVIRVIGEPVKGAGLLIEITLNEAPLRAAMIDYGWRIFQLSAVISVITAAMLFVAVRWFLVHPISRVVSHMKSYAEAPEDARRIIRPNAGITELLEAETALQSMQTQLSASLKQKEHLAALGGAVSKISHDLRNMLTTATLLADRMEMSDDPAVRKTAPKLVGSLSRAVNLCERTLAFGKAEEPAPEITCFPMVALLSDVMEGEQVVNPDGKVTFDLVVDETVEMAADKEQVFRVVSNLVRNARQALAGKTDGVITVVGSETEAFWVIVVQDNGAGLPPKALENLFTPFQGGARQGGSGLGLAIASELIRGHGGTLELVQTGAEGTEFRIILPKTIASEEMAAD